MPAFGFFDDGINNQLRAKIRHFKGTQFMSPVTNIPNKINHLLFGIISRVTSWVHRVSMRKRRNLSVQKHNSVQSTEK